MNSKVPVDMAEVSDISAADWEVDDRASQVMNAIKANDAAHALFNRRVAEIRSRHQR